MLTEREYQIVELICNGKSDKAIADELFISINTIKFHKSSIYKKLKVNSRIEVLRELIKLGLIEVQGINIVVNHNIKLIHL